jgi:hypothetical protein
MQEDARYLELRRLGKTIETISWLCGVSTRTVRKGIQAAADRQRRAIESVTPTPLREPSFIREMVPLFPVGPYTRTSPCAHIGPIPKGSKFVCMAPDCHQSGMDHHPALQRSPATDPTPAPKPPEKPSLPERVQDPKRKSEQWAPYAKRSSKQRRQTAA